MKKLSAVLIAKNEEKNIGECLAGLSFCDEIVVVDSGSTDRTAEVARQAGARVHPREFRDYASQKNFAIAQASGEWVLLIDADERVSAGLANEVRRVVEGPLFEAYEVRRSNRIFGRWMRHGANRKDLQLRLIRKEKAAFEGAVHERIAFHDEIGRLKNVLSHHSTPDISGYMRKLNAYTSLEVEELSKKGSAPSEKKMKRRPPAVFFWRYFGQGGLLDGFEGFVFTFLGAYYEFVRQAKHWEKKVG